MRLTLLLAILAACNEYDLVRPDKEDPVPVDTAPPVVELYPDIEISPSSLDFGSTFRNCTTAPQTVTVRNVGDAELEIASIALSGSGNSAFGLHATPHNLQPGEELTFTVDFSPTAWTSFSVSAVVDSNDPDEPQVGVGLTGLGAEDQIFEETFTQNYNDAVDVLWVVDNSGSMSSAINQVMLNFDHFIGQFVSLGLDFHLGVVTTDMDNPTQSGRLQGPTLVIDSTNPDPHAAFLEVVNLGTNGSGSEKGFAATQAALTEPLLSTTNAGFLREDAALATIVVTDEDEDSTITPPAFATWYTTLKTDPTKVSFSAICGDPEFIGCQDPFGTGITATGGFKYVEAAGLTGGIWESICTSDWDVALQHLSVTAAGMSYEFPLTNTPSSLASLVVTVDGVEPPYSIIDGWIYESSTNSVVFDGTAIPAPGAQIVVSYPVAGECES